MKLKATILLCLALLPSQVNSQYQDQEWLVLQFNWIASRKFKEECVLAVVGDNMSPEYRGYFRGRIAVYNELLAFAPAAQGNDK